MRMHTNGSSVVLLTPTARLHWKRRGKTVAEPVPSSAGITDYDRSGMLCLTPSGDRDFSARLVAGGAVDGAAIDEENVAAVIMDDDHAYLVRGPVSIDGDWKSVIDLSAVEPIRVAWPKGLIWKKTDDTMYELAAANGPGIPDSFVPTIESNAYGTAVASVGSGSIVVVRPDSRKVDFCLEIPSQEEAAIYASPTEKGVLVTLVIDGQDSAIVHLDESGKVLAHCEAKCAPAALQLDAGTLIYNDASNQLELLDASMKPTATIDLPFAAIDSAAAPDGATFAFADIEHFVIGHVNAKGKLEIVENVAYASMSEANKRAGEIAAQEARWDAERTHGKPAVGFAAGVTPSPWTAKANSEFELTFHARSTGGAGAGISVTIGGDVLKKAEFTSVSVHGVEVDFDKDAKGNYVAELPTIELVQGVQYPLQPKPKNDAQKHAATLFLAETHIEINVRGKAGAASGELMAVTVSALESDSPPLKWMRPLTIQ